MPRIFDNSLPVCLGQSAFFISARSEGVKSSDIAGRSSAENKHIYAAAAVCCGPILSNSADDDETPISDKSNGTSNIRLDSSRCSNISIVNDSVKSIPHWSELCYTVEEGQLASKLITNARLNLNVRQVFAV